MQKRDFGNVILTVLFAAVILVLNAANFISGNIRTVMEEFWSVFDIEDASRQLLHDESMMNVYLKLAGKFSAVLDLKGYYNNLGIYISSDRYIMGYSPYADTDFETEQMIRLKEYLDEKHINLLYVNLPVKYADDSVFMHEFGLRSYRNRNADRLLERLREADIPALDLRAEAAKEGIDVKSLFYRTDHHWTVPAGFWAAGKIAGMLNQYAGYEIDPALYDLSRYTVRTIPSCWVGEQGMMVSPEYIGYDDYTYILPDFPTSFDFKEKGVHADFTHFVDLETIRSAEDIPDRCGMHYAYKKLNVRNENVSSGKVLLVCDSYANAYMAFLALGIAETDCIVLRGRDQNLGTILAEGDYDTVIVSYAEFIIGARDAGINDNKRMFDFFGDKT